MNTSNLYKVELYRFFQSLKLFVLFGVASVIVMVLMSADTSVFETDVPYGNEIQTIFKMMGMFFCIIASGRYFDLGKRIFDHFTMVIFDNH